MAPPPGPQSKRKLLKKVKSETSRNSNNGSFRIGSNGVGGHNAVVDDADGDDDLEVIMSPRSPTKTRTSSSSSLSAAAAAVYSPRKQTTNQSHLHKPSSSASATTTAATSPSVSLLSSPRKATKQSSPVATRIASTPKNREKMKVTSKSIPLQVSSSSTSSSPVLSTSQPPPTTLTKSPVKDKKKHKTKQPQQQEHPQQVQNQQSQKEQSKSPTRTKKTTNTKTKNNNNNNNGGTTGGTSATTTTTATTRPSLPQIVDASPPPPSSSSGKKKPSSSSSRSVKAWLPASSPLTSPTSTSKRTSIQKFDARVSLSPDDEDDDKITSQKPSSTKSLKAWLPQSSPLRKSSSPSSTTKLKRTSSLRKFDARIPIELLDEDEKEHTKKNHTSNNKKKVIIQKQQQQQSHSPKKKKKSVSTTTKKMTTTATATTKVTVDTTSSSSSPSPTTSYKSPTNKHPKKQIRAVTKAAAGTKTTTTNTTTTTTRTPLRPPPTFQVRVTGSGPIHTTPSSIHHNEIFGPSDAIDEQTKRMSSPALVAPAAAVAANEIDKPNDKKPTAYANKKKTKTKKNVTLKNKKSELPLPPTSSSAAASTSMATTTVTAAVAAGEAAADSLVEAGEASVEVKYSGDEDDSYRPSPYTSPISSTAAQQEARTSHNNIRAVSDSNMIMNRRLDLLGVSVYWICTGLLKEIQDAGYDPKTSRIHDIESLSSSSKSISIIRQKGKDVTSPMDGRIGASYVHCLDSNNADHVGKANYLLSYTWNYLIDDIISTLTDYCNKQRLNPKRTYIWIDCLCINQHRVLESKLNGETGLMNFDQEFPEQLSEIGHLLALMTPWKEPEYLKRIWCIFEIYTAYDLKDCQVSIVMPPKERTSLESDLFDTETGTLDTLFYALSRTKVQNAQASYESDRVTILEMIHKNVGYDTLNSKVNECLRNWIRGCIDDIIEMKLTAAPTASPSSDDKIQSAHLMHRICNFLLKSGEVDEAYKWNQKCLSLIQSTDKYKLIADCNVLTGDIYHTKGQYNESWVEYRKALALQEHVFGFNSAEVATSYNKMAVVLMEKGDWDGALSAAEDALKIRSKVFGKDHIETASTYDTIGRVLKLQGNYNGALFAFGKALRIRQRVHNNNTSSSSLVCDISDHSSSRGTDSEQHIMNDSSRSISSSTHEEDYHPDIAISYNYIGTVLLKLKQYKRALSNLRKAFKIQEFIFGETHIDSATSHHNIGYGLRCMNDLEGSFIQYNQCCLIREMVLGVNHVDTAAAYTSLGHVQWERGNYKMAIEEYQKSLKIYKTVFGGSSRGNIDHTDSSALDCGGNDSSVAGDDDVVERSKHSALDPKIAAMHSIIAKAYKEIALMNEKNKIKKGLACDDMEDGVDANSGSGDDRRDKQPLSNQPQRYKELALQHAQNALHMYESLYGNDNDHTRTNAAKSLVDEIECLTY